MRLNCLNPLTVLSLCTLMCYDKVHYEACDYDKETIIKHVTLWCRLYSFWMGTLAASRAWRKLECHSSEECSGKNYMILISLKGTGGTWSLNGEGDPFFLGGVSAARNCLIKLKILHFVEPKIWSILNYSTFVHNSFSIIYI